MNRDAFLDGFIKAGNSFGGLSEEALKALGSVKPVAGAGAGAEHAFNGWQHLKGPELGIANAAEKQMGADHAQAILQQRMAANPERGLIPSTRALTTVPPPSTIQTILSKIKANAKPLGLGLGGGAAAAVAGKPIGQALGNASVPDQGNILKDPLAANVAQAQRAHNGSIIPPGIINKILDHLDRNKLSYGVGGAALGGGALAYSMRNKNKKKDEPQLETGEDQPGIDPSVA